MDTQFRTREQHDAYLQGLVEGMSAQSKKLADMAVKVGRLKAALDLAGSEAQRYAECYPQSSDGRNTFIMLRDRIADLAKDASRE